jgi:hypothetical protein
MSFFYIRAWVDGSDIVAIDTGEGPITPTGDYGNATIIDAVGAGAYVDAGTLRPTLTYANSVLSSSLVTIYPAKDVTSLFANADYTGQAVYNWADDNLYQWNGNPWAASFLGSAGVLNIANGAASDAVAGTRSYLATIFRRDTSTPATPSGGSYNFDGQVLTPPSGWSADIPVGTDPLWLSQALASSPTPDGIDTNLDWGVPVAFAQDGDDGVRGPGRWYIDVDGRHNLVTSPLTEAEARTEWNFASGSNDIPLLPVVYDQVIFYNGTEENPTKQQAFICTSVSSETSHTWNGQEALIDGDLLVTGTVTTDKLVIGDSSLSSDGSGGLLVQGGNITILRDNFYTANTPIDGSGFSTPPNTSDLSLVGGNSLSVPAGFTADLQIVVSFEHGYYNLPGFNDDWGLRITGGFSGGTVSELYARYNPTMTLETDYATVAVVKRNLANPSSVSATNYNVYVFWGGGSSDIELLRVLTSCFVRFK